MSSVPALAELAQHEVFEQIAESDDTWAQVVQARKEKKKRDLHAAEEEVQSLNRALDNKKNEMKKLKAEIKGVLDWICTMNAHTRPIVYLISVKHTLRS